MFGWQHVLAEWFKGWKHPLKANFELARNVKGNEGIAVNGYMIVYVENGKLRLLYTGEYPDYLNAADKELFDKLSQHLLRAYNHIKKLGWVT